MANNQQSQLEHVPLFPFSEKLDTHCCVRTPEPLRSVFGGQCLLHKLCFITSKSRAHLPNNKNNAHTPNRFGQVNLHHSFTQSPQPRVIPLQQNIHKQPPPFPKNNPLTLVHSEHPHKTSMTNYCTVTYEPKPCAHGLSLGTPSSTGFSSSTTQPHCRCTASVFAVLLRASPPSHTATSLRSRRQILSSFSP